MLKITINKHGSLNYKGREIKTPCTIKVTSSIEDIEARLRSCGFKENDYTYDLDDDIVYDQHSTSLKNKSEKGKDIFKNIVEDIYDKINELPSMSDILSIKSTLDLILEKIDELSKKKQTSSTYRRKKEIETK